MIVGLLLAIAVPCIGQPQAGQKYYYEDPLIPFFMRDERKGIYLAQRPGAGPANVEFPIVKSTGTLRVFLIGGSIAHSFGNTWYPDMSPAQARLIDDDRFYDDLRLSLPRNRIELVNCGMDGYDSVRESKILGEILDYSPDLIILMTGHNEGLGSGLPNESLYALQKELSRLAVFRRLVQLLGKRGTTDQDVERRALELSAAFMGNMRDMIRAARARGVPIVVMAPPLNYRDAPPESPALITDPLFWAGWTRYLKKDYKAAREYWSKDIAAIAPGQGRSLKPHLLFMRARAEEKSGEIVKADADYQDALWADWETPGRCSPVCAAILKEVSQQEGALLVDTDAAFRRQARPSSPGLDFFSDAVHWIRPYDRLVTLTILRSLRRSIGFKNLAWDDGFIGALEKRQAQPVKHRDEKTFMETIKYAVADMHAERLSWKAVAFLEFSYAQHPHWFENVDGLVKSLESREDWKGGPWDMAPLNVLKSALLWHLGEVRARRGDFRGALADYSTAFQLDPGPRRAGIALSQAIVQAVVGEKEASLNSLRYSFQNGMAVEAEAVNSGLDIGLGGRSRHRSLASQSE
ncbi:MAG: SGNH/GDSL hydrolase family protein [Elusimicrobia bacterium]|nr:SGNH/GDSL hydrolase family protein [Elusimicrobiota bacterium]